MSDGGKRHSVSMSPKKRKIQKSSITKIVNNNVYDRYSYGQCIVSCVDQIPWPWLLSKYSTDININKPLMPGYFNYQLFFRCGGIQAEYDEHSNEIELILFNSANLNQYDIISGGRISDNSRGISKIVDAYFCKLPSFKKSLESPFIVYDECRAKLLQFGGYHDGKAVKYIGECNLNVENVKQLRWKKVPNNMQKGRYGTNICQIDRNKYMIIGGKSNAHKPMKDCELFDYMSSYDSIEDGDIQCSMLNKMNRKRYLSSSIKSENKMEVIVAGGMLFGKGSMNIEIYDIHKNVFNAHAAEFNFEHKFPCVWFDSFNPHLLYIAGDWIGFGGRRDSLGFVEWIDLRMKCKQWNILGELPLQKIFQFENVRTNIWESRSLTVL